jgi:hypothetical protein
MKFVKLLLLALCFSCALSSNLMRKVKSKLDRNKTFKLAVFGDIGQIDEFFQKAILDKNLNSDDFKAKSLEEKAKYIEERCLYDSQPDGDMCKPNAAGLKLKMSNFEKIKTLLEDEKADQNVLLGDALYTESKNMGKYYGTQNDLIKDQVNELIGRLNKSASPVLKKALKKLQENPLFENQIKERQQKKTKAANMIKSIEKGIAQRLIKTSMENLSLANDQIKRIKIEYYKRQLCGWVEVEKTIAKLNENDKLFMSYGNHAYDVSYTTEQFIMSEYMPWKVETTFGDDINGKKEVAQVTSLPNKPKLSYSDVNGVKVWFLDFDMTPLICGEVLENIHSNVSKVKYDDELNFESYRKCLDRKFADTNPGFYTLGEKIENFHISYEYYEELIKIIEKLKKAKVDWKIARIHQSIFNIERDFNGVKTNKPLMKLFKDAGINLWLASHHHSAQINFGKYEEENGYKYLITEDPGNRLEYNDPITATHIDQTKENQTTKRKIVEDEEHTEIDDYFFKKEISPSGVDQGCRHLKFNPGESKSVATINRCKYLEGGCNSNKNDKTGITTHTSTIKIHPEKIDYIIQLVTGNGGRMLDPLLSDLESDSFMLFGRAYPQEFGYYTLEFSKESGKNVAIATFKFGESDSKSKVNFVLKIVQDESVTNFDSNFIKTFKFMEYLNDKYGKYTYEKHETDSKKNKKCLKKIPFDGYISLPAAPKADTTTNTTTEIKNPPATPEAGSEKTKNPTTAQVAPSSEAPKPKPGKKVRKF